ncbi:hypothetical protein OS965_34570 [Streptomyces sp. H27-G5]|uniref:DUF2637 domain-containing protein n=1 Tax=Streptomyces sp. H27-G5 TaxID=2996698 RepID=UPI002271D1AE|nr:DUF2637 domain-containing protein [Streptomyces sp. H27-G5]MCY0923204.1 hypothetical protein [Streptomyces sp. H27-G5]
MTTTLEPAVHVPGPARPDPASPTPGDASATHVQASPTHGSASGTAAPEDTKARIRISRGLAAVCLIGGPLLLGIGFYLSFNNLSAAAWQRFGFNEGAQSVLFAVGVDAAIVIFLGMDLLFVSRHLRPYRWLRPAAHAMAAATIVLNSMAHGLTNWEMSVPHSLPPILAIVLVESGRDFLVQVAALERGQKRDVIPWHRWAMHPIETAGIFRVMKKWEQDYDQVREQRRDLAIHEVWLDVQKDLEKADALAVEAREAARKAAVDRLPGLLAPHGVDMEEALALPDRMQAKEQRRQHETAERNHQLAEEKAKLDHEAAMSRLDREDEKAGREAERDRRRGVTAADIRGDVAAAERKADAIERAAVTEAGAVQSRDAAEALADAAEADLRATEANKRGAEAKARAAEALQQEAEAKTAAAEADRLTAVKKEATAKANAAAEELNRRATEAKAAAAEAELRATEADEMSTLPKTQRDIRKVARMMLAKAGPNPRARELQELTELVDLQTVMDLLALKQATASVRRAEAAQLIKDGYEG